MTWTIWMDKGPPRDAVVEYGRMPDRGAGHEIVPEGTVRVADIPPWWNIYGRYWRHAENLPAKRVDGA